MRSWGEEEEFASQALKLDKPQETGEEAKMMRMHPKYSKMDKPRNVLRLRSAYACRRKYS